ncbi:MAG TPA: DUF3857 domain-containing protein [Acidobacteriota bacterium]|nr:DUF3857 domain-containing protein [Acidobacteriota bacterium]
MTVKRRVLPALFISTCLLILATLPTRARAADWPPITPEEQALTSVPQQPGAPAVILNREEIADDTKHFHSVYMRIKILTEAGRRFADIRLPFDRHNFTIDTVSGRTVHADGSIVPFEGKPFEQVINKGHDVRHLLKTFTLPDVQVGSIIEYRYFLRYGDRVAVSPFWIVPEELFQKQASFRFVPFRKALQLAHGRIGNGVSWSSFLPADYKVEEEHTVVTDSIKMNLRDVPAFVEEPYMPPARVLQPRVRFFYQVGGTMDQFWKEEGKYWHKEVESFLDHNSGIADAARQKGAAGDTPEQKAKKLYAFVAQMDNRSYVPQRAQQEEKTLGLQYNDGAQDVLRQKSGTHDDLNRLFVALLRAADIPAWIITVPDRSDTFFDEHYLSMDQFDAEIVIAQINGKEVYLDPGTRFCPYGLVDWHYSASRGMRESANGKGTEFGEVPTPTYKDAMTKRVARLHLKPDGSYEGIVGVGFFGLEGMVHRRNGGKTDDEGRKKELEEELKNWLPKGSEVSLTKSPKWDDTEAPLVAEFKISGPLATSAGKRWLVPEHVFQVNETPRFPANDRVNPVYIDFAYREIDDVQITLPPGATVDSLPADDSMNRDFAVYSTEHKKENPSTILSTRDLAMNGLIFPQTAYKEIKSFYDKVKAGDDQPALVKVVGDAATK